MSSNAGKGVLTAALGPCAVVLGFNSRARLSLLWAGTTRYCTAHRYASQHDSTLCPAPKRNASRRTATQCNVAPSVSNQAGGESPQGEMSRAASLCTMLRHDSTPYRVSHRDTLQFTATNAPSTQSWTDGESLGGETAAPHSATHHDST